MTQTAKPEGPVFHARSVTELIALRAETQGDEPAVHTGSAEFEGLQTLTWVDVPFCTDRRYADVAKAVDRLAAHYAYLADTHDTTPRVIAVLTSTAIDLSLLEIALAKLGLTALLLSVNNSPAAVAHLCKITEARHLIYGHKFTATVAEAQSLLAAEGIPLQLVEDKRFPLWGPGGVRDTVVPKFPARLTPDEEKQRACVILHSSGSTGFPKPVYISHYGLIANAAVSVPKTGFSALPLFHGFGHFSIFRCMYHGKTFTLFPPHLPITASNIVRVINDSPTPPVQHFAVPFVLKLLAETAEGVESLAKMEAVSFAGAAVPDDLGDRLVAAGVRLFSQYGTTETGALMTSNRDFDTDKAWNYVRNEGLIAKYLELEPHGNGVFEVIVKDGWPAKIMSNREDGAYCTKDLVQQHPDHPTWLKYIGRLDDTLTLSVGEKTNPVPIELDVRGNSPLVAECIVFGDQRPNAGALLLPSEAGAELSKDPKAFIDAVWPVIEDANSRAPSHSRILPEMVDVLPYGTEIPVATKMSILRPACYAKFKDVIDGVFERFERGTGVVKRTITDKGDMEVFLTEAIAATLGDASGLTPDTDLFAFGINSLQATRIRNDVQKKLELGGATLGQNIVYEYPSISALADHVLAVGSGEATTTDSSRLMLEMVDKWSAKVDEFVPKLKSQGRVVLTGATGSLGAHILDQLTRRDDVEQFICLVRAKNHAEARDRVLASLAQRKRTINESKLTAYAADVNAPNLGLTAAEYTSLNPGIVIHNAWPVNFVLSLPSFDPHVGGAVNLLNLAQHTGADFLFSSSVSTTTKGSSVPEEFSTDPASAAMGYGQSKWVVEKIIERTRGTVLRIGQLVGDSQHGIWNESEAWPLLFKSVEEIHALPELGEVMNWLPVDVAAAAIVDVAEGTKGGVYHIVNPNGTHWDTILDGLGDAGVKFECISIADWLHRLEGSRGGDVNPTVKLLGYFQARLGKGREVVFDVTKSSSISKAISNCQAVDQTIVAKWVTSWRDTGFLH